MKKQPHQRLIESAAKFYICEIILALEYLHMKGFLYRDMKPENILIGCDGHIRLTDFDLARDNSCAPMSGSGSSSNPVLGFDPKTMDKVRSDASKTDVDDAAVSQANVSSRLAIKPASGGHSFVGTIEYIPPEVILGQEHAPTVDWWIGASVRMCPAFMDDTFLLSVK
eukprot:SAG31_NODE_4018_length_3662_cov_2.628964_1_plen_168_part_00